MSRLLIVVDMQNDFIDGSLGTPQARQIVPAVAEKVRSYQEAGDQVVFTMDTHFENYMGTLEGKHLPVFHCVKGTPGWELCSQLEQFQGERFEKMTFGSRELAEYIAKREYDSIELAGLCTDICVISNALMIKAFVPGVPIQVDPRCCAGVTPQSHENALNAMKMCQIDILEE